jgi:hypothetical protein
MRSRRDRYLNVGRASLGLMEVTQRATLGSLLFAPREVPHAHPSQDHRQTNAYPHPRSPGRGGRYGIDRTCPCAVLGEVYAGDGRVDRVDGHSVHYACTRPSRATLPTDLAKVDASSYRVDKANRDVVKDARGLSTYLWRRRSSSRGHVDGYTSNRRLDLTQPLALSWDNSVHVVLSGR